VIAATSWKRFAALGTDFARNYRNDFFIRTETNIIVLQVVYVLLVLLITTGSIIVLYHDIVGSIAEVVALILTSNTPTLTSSAVLERLETLRTREITIVVTLVSVIAVIFGYLATHFALKPVRDARNTQKQFIGNIAHELRTPLSIIKTNTEVRLLDADITPATRSLHESNLEELDRISNIINNLLSLNTLIRPERVPFENVDVVMLSRRVIKKLKHLTDRKRLRIRVLARLPHRVFGNVFALEQILMNTISNAVRYTERGDVTVSFGENTRGQIDISIRDTGIGISREDLIHILEPFYRGDTARTRGNGTSSGLGLTIASELVKLHRGRISIQSTPREGTEVIVTLPAGTDENLAETKK